MRYLSPRNGSRIVSRPALFDPSEPLNSARVWNLTLFLLLFAPNLSVYAQTCQSYKAGVKVGNIEDDKLDESSGVVASRRNPGVWWSHNDSGGKPRIYAMDEKGKDLGHFDLPNATNIDWEDIAAGPCPDGSPCLFIGDVGDNARARSNIVIYRVPEPQVDPNNPRNGDTAKADVFILNYPDGPHNCETLLVHPTTREVILVTKETNNTGVVYRIAGDATPGRLNLAKVTTIKVQGTLTGGDISPLGDQVVLRTYAAAFLYKAGKYGIPQDDQLIGMVTTPLVTQGEAIAYSLDGRHLFMTTENKPMPLYKLSCQDGPEPVIEPTTEKTKEPPVEPSQEKVATEPPQAPNDAGNLPEPTEPKETTAPQSGCGCDQSGSTMHLVYGFLLLCLVGFRKRA